MVKTTAVSKGRIASTIAIPISGTPILGIVPQNQSNEGSFAFRPNTQLNALDAKRLPKQRTIAQNIVQITSLFITNCGKHYQTLDLWDFVGAVHARSRHLLRLKGNSCM